jgi:hypothetical protein
MDKLISGHCARADFALPIADLEQRLEREFL